MHKLFLFCLTLFGLAKANAQLVYQELPEDFQPNVEVAACYISVGEHFLFLKHLPHKANGNAWGVPGGKMEKGESPYQCVIREVREETGMDVSGQPAEYFGEVYVRAPRGDFVYHIFALCLSEYPSEVIISSTEHEEYRWMTLKEALNLRLIPGEDECLELLYGVNLQ